MHPNAAMKSTAELYHERTKYRPDTMHLHQGMNPATQPTQFKEYAGAEGIELADRLPFRTGGAMLELAPVTEASRTVSLDALARILFFTNGVTGVAQAGEDLHFFRAAPSAGALYPTEIYVLVRAHPELESGVYNFNVREHALKRVVPQGLGPEDDELFEALSHACLGHPAIKASDLCLVFSALYVRSSWRYGERAYRRCLLDTGHVIGNLCAYLAHEGYTTSPISGFVDREICDLLSINPEQEGPCVVAPLLARPQATALDVDDAPRGLRSSAFRAIEAAPAQGLLTLLGKSSSIERSEAGMAFVATDRSPNPTLQEPQFRFGKGLSFEHASRDPVGNPALTIVRRRSARSFTGDAIRKEQLAVLLEYAYRFDLVDHTLLPSRLLIDPSLLSTWIVAHSVEGVSPGVYHYAPAERALHLVETGDFREKTHELSLGQDLAYTAAAVVIHTCDLPAAVETWGDRAYRIAHLDAGHIGQRLSLAAVATGLGSSGIGGFFDEQVNDLLAIPAQQACIYITCLGRIGRQT